MKKSLSKKREFSPTIGGHPIFLQAPGIEIGFDIYVRGEPALFPDLIQMHRTSSRFQPEPPSIREDSSDARPHSCQNLVTIPWPANYHSGGGHH